MRLIPGTTRRPIVADPKRRALTPDEIAARLGLTTKQLRQLRHRGDGPTFVALARRSIRYLQSSLDEWAARPALPSEEPSA